MPCLRLQVDYTGLGFFGMLPYIALGLVANMGGYVADALYQRGTWPSKPDGTLNLTLTLTLPLTVTHLTPNPDGAVGLTTAFVDRTQSGLGLRSGSRLGSTTTAFVQPHRWTWEGCPCCGCGKS